MRLFLGGGDPQKDLPKVRFLGVFLIKYLKVADYYIIILLYIRLLLDYY